MSSPSLTTLVCKEVFDDNSQPSDEEVKDYAVHIGIDPNAEPHLLHFARDGLMQALPREWRPCYDKELNSWYYFNFETGESRWEHPLDDLYRKLIQKRRSESCSSAGEDDSKTSLKEDLKSYEEVPPDTLPTTSEPFSPRLKKGIIKLAPLKNSPTRIHHTTFPVVISPVITTEVDIETIERLLATHRRPPNKLELLVNNKVEIDSNKVVATDPHEKKLKKGHRKKSLSPCTSPLKSSVNSTVNIPKEIHNRIPVLSPTESPNRSPELSLTQSPNESPVVSPILNLSGSPITSPSHIFNRGPITSPSHIPSRGPITSPSHIPNISPITSPITFSSSFKINIIPTRDTVKSPNTSPTRTVNVPVMKGKGKNKQDGLACKSYVQETNRGSIPASPTRVDLSGEFPESSLLGKRDLPSPVARIDVNRLQFNCLAHQDMSRKERLASAKEKHPRSMHGHGELTLTGGGAMFLKSNKQKVDQQATSPLDTDNLEIQVVTPSSSKDDPIPKGILRDQRMLPTKLWDLDPREMSFEDKQIWRKQELEEERKSVRFNLEKELDIQFNITDSEDVDENEEEAEDEVMALERGEIEEEDWNSEEEDPDEERLIAGIKVADILNLMDASELEEMSVKEEDNAENVLKTQMEKQEHHNGDTVQLELQPLPEDLEAARELCENLEVLSYECTEEDSQGPEIEDNPLVDTLQEELQVNLEIDILQQEELIVADNITSQDISDLIIQPILVSEIESPKQDVTRKKEPEVLEVQSEKEEILNDAITVVSSNKSSDKQLIDTNGGGCNDNDVDEILTTCKSLLCEQDFLESQKIHGQEAQAIKALQNKKEVEAGSEISSLVPRENDRNMKITSVDENRSTEVRFKRSLLTSSLDSDLESYQFPISPIRILSDRSEDKELVSRLMEMFCIDDKVMPTDRGLSIDQELCGHQDREEQHREHRRTIEAPNNIFQKMRKGRPKIVMNPKLLLLEDQMQEQELAVTAVREVTELDVKGDACIGELLNELQHQEKDIELSQTVLFQEQLDVKDKIVPRWSTLLEVRSSTLLKQDNHFEKDDDGAPHCSTLLKVRTRTPDMQDNNELRLKKLREQLAFNEQEEQTRLGEYQSRMVMLEKSLREKQELQEKIIRENMEASLRELRDTLSAEREAQIQAMRAEHNALLEQQRQKFAAQLLIEKERLEIEGRIEADKLSAELKASRDNILQEHLQEMESIQRQFQKDLESQMQNRTVELETAAQQQLIQQLGTEVETKRAELLESHRLALETLREEHANNLDRVRLEFKSEEDIIRREHTERLEELRARLEAERQRARERELQEDEREREAARQELVESSRVFEKLRCEKRLLEDKYRSLKEKYIRLKTDVKISIERRKRRECACGTTTGSETERSSSHKNGRPSDIERSVVDGRVADGERRVRKHTVETSGTAQASTTAPNTLTSTSTNSKQTQQSPAPSKNLATQLSPKHEKKKNTTAPLSPPGVDSDNVSSVSSRHPSKSTKHAETSESHSNNNSNNNNNRRRRQLFGRLKSSSAAARLLHHNNNNNNNNEASGGEEGTSSCSPVENLRRQLQKLEDLEDQFPASTHTDTYLRYPFTDTGHFGSSELEFFRHRIHLERDSVRRAKDFLRVQRNSFQCRQRELKQRQVDGSTTARNMLDQLYQEERELTDMEVSLHRTRALLGEKIIRLRHLEQSLHRAGDKSEVRGLEDTTLSDLSSHSGSSGFSSTELATETHLGRTSVHRGTHYQESTEIIQSLENLNTEIREIWEVLNKQQKDGSVRSVPPPPLVYPDMAWPTLATVRSPMPLPVFRQPPQGVQYSRPTVDSSLVERTRNLRDWLRQARIDSTDLMSPGQATL